MRQCVEEQVGAMIKSSTEVVNAQVISDRIVSSSEGCVLVKNVISKQNKGDVFEIILDLEANQNTIAMSAQDIKNQILHAAKDSSRAGVDVAVINGDDLSDESVGDIVTQKMRCFNYRTEESDKILEYLIAAEKQNPPPSNREIRFRLRQFGKGGTAKCLIRGKITTEPPVPAGGLYKVVAYFNGQIIGYGSNIVDAVAQYAVGVGPNPNMAKMNAQKQVALEAVDVLAQQTAETLQREQGGVW